MKKSFGVALLVSFLLAACGATAPVAPATTVPAAITPSAQTSTNSTGCTNAASFIADVTVPDDTNFKQGDAIHKIWRVKNTGICAWNSQYTLVFASGDQMGAPANTPLSETDSSDMLDIAVDMTAPNTDGTYRADFELHDPSGVAMPIDQATTLWVAITVGTAASGPGNGSGGGAGDPGLTTSTCAFTTDMNRVNDVITAINAYRAQNNLPPYNVNTPLTMAAQSHSEDMACNNLFVHTGSNGSTPSSRVAAAGYSASSVTENVYGSFPPLTGQDVVTWWATDQTDPSHNANLISTKYREIGVGYAFFDNSGYYVVDFAAP